MDRGKAANWEGWAGMHALNLLSRGAVVGAGELLSVSCCIAAPKKKALDERMTYIMRSGAWVMRLLWSDSCSTCRCHLDRAKGLINKPPTNECHCSLLHKRTGTKLSHTSAILSTPSTTPTTNLWQRFFSLSSTIAGIIIFWATAGPSGLEWRCHSLKNFTGGEKGLLPHFQQLCQCPGALFRCYSMHFVWLRETGLCLALLSSRPALCLSVSRLSLPSCQSAGADDEL